MLAGSGSAADPGFLLGPMMLRLKTINISESATLPSLSLFTVIAMPLKLENVEVDVAFQVSHQLLKCQSCK